MKFTIIVLAVTSLLLAGTILAPIQASALSKFKTNTDTSSLKQGIRDGVSVNQEHRDQHMNQESLCYRTNICRQANDGQNTLGNDNSVTGFADQSNNILHAPTDTATTAQGVILAVNNVLWFGFQADRSSHSSLLHASTLESLCNEGVLNLNVLREALNRLTSDQVIIVDLIGCLHTAGVI